MGQGVDDTRGESCWFDGGPETRVGKVRDSSEGISVVMQKDVALVRLGKMLAAVVLPMPAPPPEWKNWPRLRGIPIAPEGSIDYDPKRGAEWRRK